MNIREFIELHSTTIIGFMGLLLSGYHMLIFKNQSNILTLALISASISTILVIISLQRFHEYKNGFSIGEQSSKKPTILATLFVIAMIIVYLLP